MTFYLFWSGLIFRGICFCTAGIPALFAAATFPYWEFLTANGRCTWRLMVRLDTDFPSMAHCTSCSVLTSQLTTLLLPSSSISGVAAREQGGAGGPTVHFVIYSAPCTLFWDSTRVQLVARKVVVMNITLPLTTSSSRSLGKSY